MAAESSNHTKAVARSATAASHGCGDITRMGSAAESSGAKKHGAAPSDATGLPPELQEICAALGVKPEHVLTIDDGDMDAEDVEFWEEMMRREEETGPCDWATKDEDGDRLLFVPVRLLEPPPAAPPAAWQPRESLRSPTPHLLRELQYQWRGD